jgi:hypothetical protein
MGLTGVSLTVFNIVTRRKKGKRQALISQIILVVFIAFIGAFNYYLLFDEINGIMYSLMIINALYYINSIIYVRSKTEGAPYHILALVSVLLTIGFILLSGDLMFLKPVFVLLFIPSLVKVLDNVILENKKVHLRRIGLNEVFHCLLFLLLMNHLVSSI